MTYEQVIELLESEWAPDDGFFWRVRQGIFNDAEFRRALTKIESLEFDEDAPLPRRVVALLWYIPLVMQWNAERVREQSGVTDVYARAVSDMTNEVERLLGAS